MIIKQKMFGIVATAVLSMFALVQSAGAMQVAVDGVKDGMDNYTGSFTTTWYNVHKTEDSI